MIEDPKILQGIFLSSAEGIIIADQSGKIIMNNPRAEHMFGYEPEELRGKPIEALLPDRIKEKHKAYRQGYFENPRPRSMGQGLDLYGLRKCGKLFPLEVSLSYSTIEGQMYAIAFVIDITSRKQAEQRLVKSEERMRYFVEHTPVAVAMTDRQLHYLLLSSRWLKDQNSEVSELIGKRHPEVFHNHQERWYQAYEKALSGEIVRCEEDMVQHTDGSQDWLRWEVHPWKEESGAVGGLIIFVEDITKRKIAENALKKSRADLKKYTTELERSNRELEDFAYVSSHDLQEPLRKIQAFGDRLKKMEHERLDERSKDYIDRMLNSANRMQVLINDLLTFSRVTTKAKPFERVSLNKVLREVLTDIEVSIESNHATVTIEDLPEIDGDPTQFRQLFQNLLSNAIKFKQPGLDPIIKVHWEKVKRKPHPSLSMGKNEYARIYVEDNGIGFEERFLDKIFNIFQRLEGRKYPGSGIGLSICKKIVQRHNGSITAQSAPSKGSKFIIELPLKQT